MTPSVQATEGDSTIDARQEKKKKANSEEVGEEDPAWRSIKKDNLSCGCE